jgi:hypothetical protein
MIVMPHKIKYQPPPSYQHPLLLHTPMRNTLSRITLNTSGLKKLSQERDLKKIEKQRDSSN